jgi:hypothetical protein
MSNHISNRFQELFILYQAANSFGCGLHGKSSELATLS